MRYRLYFNRIEDWPRIWSIDDGDVSTERTVLGFDITGCQCRSQALDPIAAACVDRAVMPIGWLQITAAALEIREGWAIFHPPRGGGVVDTRGFCGGSPVG